MRGALMAASGSVRIAGAGLTLRNDLVELLALPGQAELAAGPFLDRVQALRRSSTSARRASFAGLETAVFLRLGGHALFEGTDVTESAVAEPRA